MRMSTSAAKSTLKILLLAVAVAAAIAAGAGAAEASTGSTPLAVVPVTGTTSDGGTFTGTMSVDSVTVQNGVPIATGTVTGTATDGSSVQDAQFTAPMQVQQASTCTLFAFSIGPIDLDLAGQVTVHIEPIGVKIGLEGLLGTLLCGILGGGTPPVPA